MVNDLKQFVSQKHNDLLQNIFDIYEGKEVDYFFKENIDELDFAIVMPYGIWCQSGEFQM